MSKHIKYPKIGDIFYWKDNDGDVHEAVCMKIEGEDIDTLETMFYTYISKNGGGCFVTESDIIDSNSEEVEEFKKAKYKEKINELVNMLKDEDTSSEIIDILSNIENYYK